MKDALGLTIKKNGGTPCRAVQDWMARQSFFRGQSIKRPLQCNPHKALWHIGEVACHIVTVELLYWSDPRGFRRLYITRLAATQGHREMQETTPRYAIYFVPAAESNLYRFGASVLGYDCYSGADLALGGVDATQGIDWPALTEEPRRYGFHATLKAPFFLSPSCEEAQLASAVQSFAGLGRDFASFDPEVRRLGDFVAIVPRVPNRALDELANQCVTIFDAFRAPMTAQERSRRLASGLSQSQLQNLDRWGYPYLFKDFRFHMTLTGKVPPKTQDAVVTRLAAGFSSMYGAQPIVVDRLALLKQDDETARFRVISQAVLGPR